MTIANRAGPAAPAAVRVLRSLAAVGGGYLIVTVTTAITTRTASRHMSVRHNAGLVHRCARVS